MAEIIVPRRSRIVERGAWKVELMTDETLVTDSGLDAQIRLVVDHFNDFVNRRDLSAIDRNMTVDFVDHDGPGGRTVGREADRAMMAKMHDLFPDLHVEVTHVVAQGDKVVVRNCWTGTNAATGDAIEFHGFVMWRIEAGKIAERWATVTPIQTVTAEALRW